MADQHNHKAEISYKRISILLGLLGFVWVLCYNAELQFPQRHISDTYDRIGDRQVTKQSYNYATLLLQNIQSQAALSHHAPNTVNKQQRNGKTINKLQDQYLNYMLSRYKLSKQKQKHICILLFHKPKWEQYMETIRSILNQDYTNYKVFYFNNYASGQEVYNYVQENSLDKQKIKIIDDFPYSNYKDEYEQSRDYCDHVKDNIVVYMADQQVLLTQNVFTILNGLFSSNQNLRLLYTTALVRKPNQTDSSTGPNLKSIFSNTAQNGYQLSRSYPYPQNIIKTSTYNQITYLIGGLKCFRVDILNSIKPQQLLNKGSYFTSHQATHAALGMKLLKYSKSNIMYLPQPLVLTSQDNQHLSLDTNAQKQFKQIRKAY